MQHTFRVFDAKSDKSSNWRHCVELNCLEIIARCSITLLEHDIVKLEHAFMTDIQTILARHSTSGHGYSVVLRRRERCGAGISGRDEIMPRWCRVPHHDDDT